MGIPITVCTVDAAGHRRDVDLAVSSIQHLTIAELATLVSVHIGRVPDLPVAVDGRPVGRDALALTSGVRAGARVTVGSVGGERRIPVAGHQLRVVGGGDAGRVVNLARGRTRIGRSASADLMLHDAEASRVHAEVRVTDDGIWLRDLSSSNGTRIGRHTLSPVEESLHLDTVFRIGNSSLTVTSLREPPATLTQQDGTVLVHRPKRPRRPAVEPVEFPTAPTAGLRPTISLLSALIPAAMSIGVAAALHNTQLLAFAALTPIMVVSSGASDRWSWRRRSRQEREGYRRTLRAAEQALADAAAVERIARDRDFPDAAAVSETVRTADARLFERAIDDPEFLLVRLGLADQPAQSVGESAGVAIQRPVLPAVPATVSLRDGTIGIAGPHHLVHGSARWLVAQLATLQCPSEVQLYLLGGRRTDWRWLRWLPGFQRAAETPEETAELIVDLVAEYDRRVTQGGHIRTGGSSKDPWLIVLIDSPSQAGLLTRFGTAVADGWRVGISLVILIERAAVIPEGCRTTVVYDADDPAMLTLHGPADVTVPAVIADRVSQEYAEQLARGLAPMLDAMAGSTSTGRATERLLDLLDLSPVTPELLASHWAQQGPANTTLPIGTTSAGPLQVDLTADGPHILIAGSTGSGKSELLRALVLSLAVAQPPDRLSMVLIDYKGGAAFADCDGLPHTSAVITDLDLPTTRRALLSVGAELRRREAAFARTGVADLASYQATPEGMRDPIARLVLVVDEFASLADELPGFLDGLLGIAQRGRSLGVHLILATQRPAGVVSADMRANMPLRIALRVTEPTESVDVIGVDAAARIAKNRPGHGFAVFSEGLVEFQAARVDLPPPSAGPSVQILDAWNRPVRTAGCSDGVTSDSDLSEFCRTAQQAARIHRIEPAVAPWLPALPSTVTVADLPNASGAVDSTTRISFGLVDEPTRQRQYPASHELSIGGSIGFVGSAQSGRTTALRTFIASAARSLAPDDLHCHVIDCASGALRGISSLPHCGSFLTRHDPASILRLTELLGEEIAIRQQQLVQVGASTAHEAASQGLRLPLLILAVDGWDEFATLSEDHDAGRSLSMMLAIMRNATSAGVTVLVAGERALFGARISTHLSRRFVFRLHDRGDYGLAGLSPAAMPRSWPAGRAMIADDALEVQFALLDGDPSTAAQEARLGDIAARWNTPTRRPPVRVRPLPIMCPPSLPLLAGRDQILLGLGGDAATPVTIRVSGAIRLLVTGPPGSGRTTTLLRIGAAARQLGQPIVVMAEAGSRLADWAREARIPRLRPDAVEEVARLGNRAEAPFPLLLIDDTAPLNDPTLSDELGALVAAHTGGIALAVRSEQLFTSFRGAVPEMLRHRSGVLLQPSNADRDAFGLRTGRPTATAVPGRGVLVTDSTRHKHPDGLPIQVAMP